MTRPRKRLLLYCVDEFRRSRVAFVLNTRCVAVTQVDSLALLGHELDHNLPFDGALVLESAGFDAEEAVRAIQCHAGRAPVLLQAASLDVRVSRAERVLAPGTDMAELVEAARVLCSRKRGPRPLRGVLDASREKQGMAVA